MKNDPARTTLLALSAAFGLSIAASLVPLAASAGSSVFATGLNGPMKLDLTERGALLVSERGTGNDDGRLSIVDRFGNVRPLVSGLPSGLEVLGQPSGPTGVKRLECCVVHLTIGEGDTLRFAPTGLPGTLMPNPDRRPPDGPVDARVSSPLFSSLLRLVFNGPLDEVSGGFELTAANQQTLADGFTVQLKNGAGEKVWIRLVVDIKDFRPDPDINVRGSNPFGLTHGERDYQFLIADGGGNSLMQISPFEAPRTLLRFAPVANPAGVLPPFTDAVPTSVVRAWGDRYLVTLFAGVPFAEGTSSVRLVDVGDRTESVLIPGLTSAIDVLPLGATIYVLEHSVNLFGGAPGRLLRFSSPTATPTVLVNDLAGATSMVYSPRQRSFFVTELFANQVRRVELP